MNQNSANWDTILKFAGLLVPILGGYFAFVVKSKNDVIEETKKTYPMKMRYYEEILLKLKKIKKKHLMTY